MGKICKICSIEKDESEYNKAGGGKWLQPYCKPCDSIRKKKYFDNNKERLNKKSRDNYLKNRKLVPPEIKKKNIERSIEILKINAKKYREEIGVISKEEKKRRKSDCDRRYREKNKEKLKIKKKEYYDKIGLEKAKQWQLSKKTDLNYVTKKRLRGRIYAALKKGIKSDSTINLLGCSIEHFKAHFESLFTEGMSWEKYLEGGIHIDHKIPCASFDLTDEKQQKICFHYTNLQPLWWIDNLIKGAKII